MQRPQFTKYDQFRIHPDQLIDLVKLDFELGK